MKYQYDLLVIGSGSAGFSAATAAKGTGRKIGIVESGKFGGECPNWACVPTKILLRSAHLYREIKTAEHFGIKVGKLEYSTEEIMRRRNKLTGALGGKRIQKIAEEMGFEVITGHAIFLDNQRIQVGEKKYTSERFIIATGSKSRIPRIQGIENVKYIDFKKAASQKTPPKSMIVIGGGPVGCELATYYATFGTKVTILQGAPAVLNREEPEISEIALKSLEELEIEVHLKVDVLELSQKDDRITAKVRTGKEIKNISADQLFMATGKTSNTASLGAKAAGVEIDERGTIVVNRQLQTTAKNIWAAGDVDGGMMFTHVAHHEGALAGKNAFAGKKGKRIDRRVIPRATFIHPEVGSVGLTEAQAIEKYKEVIVGKFEIKRLGRAYIDGKNEGIVKIVANKKTRKIVGAGIIGERAGELIHEIALAMHLNAKMEDMANMLHAYPTYSEAIAAAAATAE